MEFEKNASESNQYSGVQSKPDQNSKTKPTNDQTVSTSLAKVDQPSAINNKKAPVGFIAKLKKFWSVPKNRVILEASLGLIVVIIVGFILYRWYTDNNNISVAGISVKKSAPSQEIPPETAANILDGTQVLKALATRHPLGVIIENHVDARPQSGLSAAGIVYEGIAEGGITRYLALFSGNDAAKIGPIRSARTYFVDLARGFGAYFAHIGGNYDALTQIKSENILDLDQFANSAYYWRDTTKKTSSEHTVYSSTDKLYTAASKKGYSSDNTFTPFKFKTDVAEASRPASQTVSIEFGSAQYKDTFSYDHKSNTYFRSIGTLPDQDLETGKRIAPKNLILQEVVRHDTITAINEKGYIFDMVGSGKAKIFQDGKMIEGTWKNSSDSQRTFYYDAAGNEIQFNPGQTWVCLTHADLKISIE